MERYQSEYRKKSLGKKLSEVFGFIPLSGAAYGAGSTYMAALTVGSLKDFLFEQVPYIIGGGNAVYALQTSMQRGYEAAGQWAVVGGIAGLLLTYKFEKSIKSLLWGEK